MEKKRVKDILADHAKDWTTLALAGLGISFSPHEWVGGVLLAIAGATFAMRSEPEQDQRELWLVILGAFLASHLAGIVSNRMFPGFPVQIAMFAAGFFSRRLTRFALRFAGMLEKKSDRIADRVIDTLIPGKDNDE